MQLFAERGFRQTTVGDIEAAVGLQPRRGALYRHFTSKEALLQTALYERLQAVDEASEALTQLPLVDLRAEAMAMGAWLLGELDRERVIMRIFEHDGDRLVQIRDLFRERVVDAGYRAAAALARRWLGAAADTIDTEALSVVLLGALINYRRSTWTFASPPLQIEDQRFLSCWADLCVSATAAVRSHDKD